eukprot:254796-Chlamydomonas_euryale.AAC.1
MCPCAHAPTRPYKYAFMHQYTGIGQAWSSRQPLGGASRRTRAVAAPGKAVCVRVRQPSPFVGRG